MKAILFSCILYKWDEGHFAVSSFYV